MKGTLWFAEEKSHLYSFNMSSRQRYEITPQASVYVGDSLVGSFTVQLVAIGQGIDQAAIRGMLENCTASGGDAVPCSTPLYSDASALIASDPRFEVLVEQKLDHLSGQPVSVSTNYIDFRVTGTIEYGVSVEEASAIHGIDFNRMNRELAKRVNGCSGPVSILPVQLPTGLQVCRHALASV